eukprot:2477987-Pleurochrysis_carterae.AAC.1
MQEGERPRRAVKTPDARGEQSQAQKPHSPLSTKLSMTKPKHTASDGEHQNSRDEILHLHASVARCAEAARGVKSALSPCSSVQARQYTARPRHLSRSLEAVLSAEALSAEARLYMWRMTSSLKPSLKVEGLRQLLHLSLAVTMLQQLKWP